MIGKRIAELRSKKGLTQEEFAAKLGVSRSALSLWEQGRRKVDQELLPQIAEYFGVTTDYLLKGRNLVEVLVERQKNEDKPNTSPKSIDSSESDEPTELTDILLIGKKFTYMGEKLNDGDIILIRHMIEMSIRHRLPEVIPIYPPRSPRDISKIPRIEDIDPESLPHPVEFMWKDQRINRYEILMAEGRRPNDEDWKHLLENYKYHPPKDSK